MREGRADAIVTHFVETWRLLSPCRDEINAAVLLTDHYIAEVLLGCRMEGTHVVRFLCLACTVSPDVRDYTLATLDELMDMLPNGTVTTSDIARLAASCSVYMLSQEQLTVVLELTDKLDCNQDKLRVLYHASKSFGSATFLQVKKLQRWILVMVKHFVMLDREPGVGIAVSKLSDIQANMVKLTGQKDITEHVHWVTLLTKYDLQDKLPDVFNRPVTLSLEVLSWEQKINQ